MFKSWLPLFLAVWMWANYVAALGLPFLSLQTEKIIWICRAAVRVNEVKYAKHSE